MGRKQKYSKDLKIEICKKYISGEKSAKELSNIYGLGRYGDNLINTWVRQYQKNSSLIFEEKQKSTNTKIDFETGEVLDKEITIQNQTFDKFQLKTISVLLDGKVVLK